MKTLQIILTAFTFLILISACSSSTETTQQSTSTPQEDEVYVFDDVSDLQPEITEEPVTVEEKPEPALSEPVEVFIVQVGAFSSRDRAEKFKLAHQKDIEWEMIISYSTRVGLYVIQLSPYKTRAEAESVRNKLWRTKSFGDAFIITEMK